MSTHQADIKKGSRFEFGRNWQSFLSTLDQGRIAEARKSLAEMLGVSSLAGRRFLDIGSGSGLFSLAARQLGATVHSFDYDPASVACAAELKQRFAPGDAHWTIEEGSALDEVYLRSLGKFDIVYSWGVLHHTGDMWRGLANAVIPLKEDGRLFVAIYNDQGIKSTGWKAIKRLYCSSRLGKAVVCMVFFPLYTAIAVALSIARFGNLNGYFKDYRRKRGMSIVHDWVDWLGGYPFEVASVGAIVKFFNERNLSLAKLVETKRLGCNQFVFESSAVPVSRTNVAPVA